ncbi:hypothetical protein ABBQ32_010357 [Trebouxia sp. C0010 RCD-2024]
MIRTLALYGVFGAPRHPVSIATLISKPHPLLALLPFHHLPPSQDCCSKHQQESSRQQAASRHRLTGLLTTLIRFQAKCIGTVSYTAAWNPSGSALHENTAGIHNESNPPMEAVTAFAGVDAKDSSNSSSSSSSSGLIHSSKGGDWAKHGGCISRGSETAQAATQVLHEMHAALGRKNFAQVKQLLDPQLAEQAGPVYASRMYLCVLNAHSALHEGPLALALVKQMRAIGLSMGRLPYAHMVAAFCKAGALQDALLHVQTTVPQEAVDTYLVNGILFAACVARQPQLAVMQQCLDLLQERGLMWNDTTWRQVFRLQAQAGDLKGVVQTKADLDGSLYSHSPEVHTAYVRALCTLGHLEAAADALHHMLHLISCDGTATSKATGNGTLANEPAPVHMSSHIQEAHSHLPSSQETSQDSQPGLSPSQAAGKGPLSQEPHSGFSPPQAAGKGFLSQEPQPGFSSSQAAGKGPLSQEPQSGFSPSQAAGKGSLSYKPQPKGARGRYKESRHLKLKLVQQACHVVMTLAQRRAQPAVMLPILESMQQAGIEADTAIQNSVMRLARQQGQSPAQLEEYLLRLLTLGLQPNEQTFNLLLRAYLAHGNTVEATRILDRMGARGLIPGQYTFNALLEGHAASGDVIAAKDMYNTMQDRGIRPTHCTFIALFKVINNQARALQRGGAADTSALGHHEKLAHREALSQLLSEWVADMRAAGLKHNGPSLTALVQAYGHTMDFTKMVHLLRASWDAPSTAPPNLRTYNAAITACCRAGHLGRSLRLLHEMRALGIAPNLHTYTSLISGCGFARDPYTAYDLWGQMEAEGVAPNEMTYNAKVKVHSSVGDFDAALDTVQQMHAKGFTPDKSTWAVIVSMATLMDRPDIVHQVELQAAEIYGKPLAELADFASDVTHQDELSSLHKKTLPGSVHADDFVHDFEEGGWSSGFDDSDDDIIGGSL